MRKQFTLHLLIVCALLFKWQAATATHFSVSTLDGTNPGSLTWALTEANNDNSATIDNPHVIDICVGGQTYLWPLPQKSCIINCPKDMSLHLSGIYYNIGTNLSGIRVSINNAFFSNNQGSAFGSSFMSSCGAATTLNNCIFINNNAQYQAGGVFANGDTVIINGCTFKNNYTTDGGGEGGGAVFNNGGYMRITNSTFSNNRSNSVSGTGAGGAVKNHAGGRMDIINCTFYNNHAETNGGALQNAPASTCRISNCIFVGNTATGNGQDLYGNFTSLEGHNLFSDTTGASIGGVVAGNIYGAAALSVLDTTLRDNGHYMLTHALIAGSPAINAAENTVAGAFDQREYPRNGTPDIGAFEYNAVNPCAGFSVDIDAVTASCTDVLHELGLTVTGGTGPYTSNIYDTDVSWLCADSIIHTGSGTFIATVFDAAHCVTKDTVVIHDGTAEITYNLYFCPGDSVTFRGVTYTEEDTYTIAYGCDSILSLIVTQNPVPVVNYDIEKCAGDSVTINGTTYNTYNTYYQYYSCDSMVQIYFHELEPENRSYELSICGGDSVTVNGISYHQAGDYYQYYGCDSVVEVYIDYGQEPVIEKHVNLCYGQSVTVGSHTYNSTGIYHDFYACDSVVTTFLTVFPQLSLPTAELSGITCPGDVSGTIALSTPNSLTLTLSDTVFQFGPDTTWADSVIAFSTEYSSGSWSANQLLGPPNTYPDYGDIGTSWTANNYGQHRDFLVVGYSTPVLASEVLIYETNAPGYIDTVYVHQAGGNWLTVYTATASAGPEVSTIFRATLPAATSVDAVRWAIATDQAHNWVEYDAVGLVKYNITQVSYPVTAGSAYPVTLSAYGCTASDTITIPAPVSLLSLSLSADSICAGSSTTLAASGSLSYLWSNSATTATQVVTPAATTTYYVTATDVQGCVANDSVTITVQVCLGIDEESTADFVLQVYPNPANDFLIINCTEAIESAGVYSATGEQVLFTKGPITHINTSALAQGMYLIQVKTTAGKTLVRKFLKE